MTKERKFASRASLLTWVVVAILVCAADGSAHAGPTLDAIMARGVIRCGVSEGITGFSARDASGVWTGMDVDVCRSLAAAVLGDPEKVEFVPLSAAERFPALKLKKIDVLARNTTWTLVRESALKLQFPAILYHDWQGVIVPDSSGANKLARLDGAVICFVKGTNHQEHLNLYAQAQGFAFEGRQAESYQEAESLLASGACQACTADAAVLAGMRLRAEQRGLKLRVIDEVVAHHPLAPVVRDDDQQWLTIVRWVIFALIMAEEQGLDQAYFSQEPPPDLTPALRNVTGLPGGTGKVLGLGEGWGARAIKAAGNYGEIFERNLGAQSPLKLEREMNRLWKDGGLLYAPPIY